MDLASVGISENTFEQIISSIVEGSSILYLGNKSSNRLSEHYRVTEVNHLKNNNSTGISSIYSPIISNSTSRSFNEKGWYDPNIIQEQIESRYDVVIIDGPSSEIGRSGILGHLDLIQSSRVIIVNDVQNSSEHQLALRIAEELHGSITIHKNKPELWSTEGELAWAWINPTSRLEEPNPLPYPDASHLVPKGMEITTPIGVANDYKWIRDKVNENREGWIPCIPVSIVIPLYNRKIMLGRTLAGILNQTYPSELIEIVVADDGSDDNPMEIIEQFREHIQIRFIQQEDKGYRLSEVRNLGIRSARYEQIILLDCDMIPTPSLVECYMRHLEVSDKVVLCGHRRYVDANQITVIEAFNNDSSYLSLPDIETSNEMVKGTQLGPTLDWRIPMYQQSDDLRFEKYPFRAICGGNIAFHRSVMQYAGWFDEEFTAWGAEDTEWGFRVWNRGFYIIPLIEACGLHQEPPGGRNETDREAGRAISHPMLIDRCPVIYRKPEHVGPHFTPLVSIYIPAFNCEDSIVLAVQSALNQTIDDLEICIVDDGSTDGTLGALIENFGDNPKVRIKQRKSNGGIGAASNDAVKMCRGIYIGQLDSDDLLQPYAVEVLLNRIKRETRLGVCYGSYQRMSPEGQLIADGYVWNDFSREKLINSMIVHHFRLFRARDWWRTGGFAEDITNAVDYDIFLKLSEVTEFEHIHRWTYLYRIHDGSTSVKETDIQDRNNRIVIERALRRRKLDKQWKIIQLDPENPRRISFQNTQLNGDQESEMIETKTKLNEVSQEIIPKNNPTPIIHQMQTEERILLMPINDINECKSMIQEIGNKRQGLDLRLYCLTTGIKPVFGMATRPMEPEEIKHEIEKLQRDFPKLIITKQKTPELQHEDVPKGKVTRIRIGKTRSLDEINRILKKIKRKRRTWKLYVEARTMGPDPVLSVVTGRLENSHAKEQAIILRKKIKEYHIEVDNQAQY